MKKLILPLIFVILFSGCYTILVVPNRVVINEPQVIYTYDNYIDWNYNYHPSLYNNIYWDYTYNPLYYNNWYYRNTIDFRWYQPYYYGSYTYNYPVSYIYNYPVKNQKKRSFTKRTVVTRSREIPNVRQSSDRNRVGATSRQKTTIQRTYNPPKITKSTAARSVKKSSGRTITKSTTTRKTTTTKRVVKKKEKG